MDQRFYFLFVIVSRTIALPFFLQIYAGYYFGYRIALGKYYAHMLGIFGISFYCISWAWTSFGIALPVIDPAVLHNVFHLSACYFPAFHTAFGVPGIFQVRCPPVEPTIAVHCRGISGAGVC
jgi:hypothetical protein